MIEREINEPEESFDVDIREVEKILEKDYGEKGGAAKAIEKLKRELLAVDRARRADK